MLSFETSSKNQLFTRSAPRTSLKGAKRLPGRLHDGFGGLWAPFWEPKGGSKTDFETALGAKLETWGLQDRFWDPLGSQVGALGGQNGANTRLTFMIPSKINQLFPQRHFLDASMQLRGVPRTIFDRFFVDCSFISE